MIVLIITLVLIVFAAFTLWTQFPLFFKKKPTNLQKKLEPVAVIGLILSVIAAVIATW
ncbi:hypothetical protein [Lactovum miscens]|uniref:Co/Zn/Cd efflux system component n=1 Tax=Lactovum miscens TaxID=190387 RepID=A0A841C4A3_9LACT|nr:hypothetical protein [Lactovum miscens]MBB5887174.1 Co/Zn/Cd efflux system component [Lactovum miscens]